MYEILTIMVKTLDLQAITSQHADEYKAAMNRVLESGWFLLGEETKRFEADYARYIGTEHCVAVANGLDALRLIIRAYKVLGAFHDGDEIIVSANTYIATFLAITDNNLVPVPVEPTFENLEIDVNRVEAAITPKTRGIMIVHLYGRNAYDVRIAEICRKHGLKLMEDNAQSHGCLAEVSDGNGNIILKKTGSLGDAAAHSFYPGKNLGAMGDAGAVTTSDSELADAIRVLANYGSERKYANKYMGMNSRMSEIDAAILDVKLKYLDEDNIRRQKLAAFYYANIDNHLISLPLQLEDKFNVYHQFPILCSHRDALQKHLSDCGIQTLIHYPITPHHQECYADAVWNTPRLSLPITEKIHAQELSIPMNQVITTDEAKQVVDAINSFKLF